MTRQRIDKLLLARGLAPSRERARALILGGKVLAGSVVVDKAGTLVDETVELRLREPDHPYVSRGGLKLAHALATFGLEVAGRVALDVGASTGGFCDCLLRAGAARVHAVDVGYGQLAYSLRTDPRVNLLERTNIRCLTGERLPEQPTLGVVDVSFISLALVLPKMAELLAPAADLVALVKPQFEVGKRQVGKGGVVREPALRQAAVRKVAEEATRLGLALLGETESPIPGPAGNIEFLLWLRTPAAR